MKELNQTKPGLPYHVRLKQAVAMRDHTIKAKGIVGHDFTVEAFNSLDLLKNPDTVGVSAFYPNKDMATHIFSKIYNMNLGTVEFGKQLKKDYKKFTKKLPGA